VAYPILLAAAGVSGTVFGLLFVFAPDTAFALFGARLDPLGSLLVRQLGGVILGLAWMDWLIGTSAIHTYETPSSSAT
jgi:hypothetical protein